MDRVETWLLVHGPALWKAVVLVAAAGGAALGPTVAAAWRRVALRRRLRAMGEPASRLAEGRCLPAVLEGALEGDSADGVLAASGYGPRDRGPARAAWCAPGVVLATPHGRVSLEGAANVAEGRAVPSDPRLVERDEEPFERVLTLRAGDRVRVSGVVEPVTGRGTNAMGYRDARTAWRLVPGGEGVIPMLAVEVTAQTLGASRRAAHGLTAALAALSLFALGGAASLARADAARGPVTVTASRAVCEGGGEGWGALASASPFTRRRALDGLRVTLGCKEIRTAADVFARDLVLQVAALDARDPAGACVERAAALEDAAQYERAAAVYASCGSVTARREAARLYAFVGRYDRASALAQAWVRESSSVGEILRESAVWHCAARASSATRAAVERALDLAEGAHGPSSGAAEVRAHLSCALLRLGQRESGGAAPEPPGLCAGVAWARPAARGVECDDARVMRQLDAESAGLARALSFTGRESTRAAFERGDVRQVLQALRALDEPWFSQRVIIALVRRGTRTDEDRARIRAWVETEFRQRGERYDAGTARWLAGALGLDALLQEARAIGRRHCEADQRLREDPVAAAIAAARLRATAW